MAGLKGEWIVLGKSSIRVSWLREVKISEALDHFKGTSVHPDRVRNAWKQANGKK